MVSSFESNMFRAPAYQQAVNATDFIVAHTVDDKFYIRRVDVIFTVGQQLPKILVPKPKSKGETEYRHHRVQAQLMRIMQRRGHIFDEDVPDLIRGVSANQIRNVLKEFANLYAVGYCPKQHIDVHNAWIADRELTQRDFEICTPEMVSGQGWAVGFEGEGNGVACPAERERGKH